MRRLYLAVVVLAVWALAGCQVEILPTPLPTPSPFPIRPTRTPAPATFTPAPTPAEVSPTPRPDLPTPITQATPILPGPYPGPSSYPGAGTPGTTVDVGPGSGPAGTGTPGGPGSGPGGSGTPAAPGDARVSPRASLRVSPEQGAPGTVFTAAGQNWLPGEGVFLEMAPEGSEAAGQVGIAVVDDNGRFSATFTLPGNWETSRRIDVQARNYNLSRWAIATVQFVAATPTQVVGAWRGEYFSNPDLIGSPVWTQGDERIDFDWGEDRPHLNLPTDYFSVRWTRQVEFEQGIYEFTVTVDDGVRVYVDGDKIMDHWQVNAWVTFAANRYITEGLHTVRVEYYDAGGRAAIKFDWTGRRDLTGWRGRYFPNRNLTGAPTLVRNEPEMTFNWGGASPGPGIPGENWSARWTQTIDLPGGRYRFYLNADDGVRLSIDGERVINEWHDARAETYYADMDLAAGAHDVQVDYYQGSGDSYLDLWWEVADASQFPDWRGEYFANRDLRGRPKLVRDDPSVDFDWGSGSPAPELPGDGFSARWTRQLDIDEGSAGNYKFTIEADDGIRFWLDDELVVDRWTTDLRQQDPKLLYLTQGTHKLRVEYFEDGGMARVRVVWEYLPVR